MSPFFSMPLVHVQLIFLRKAPVYKEFKFIVTHSCHLGFQGRVHPGGKGVHEGKKKVTQSRSCKHVSSSISFSPSPMSLS